MCVSASVPVPVRRRLLIDNWRDPNFFFYSLACHLSHPANQWVKIVALLLLLHIDIVVSRHLVPSYPATPCLQPGKPSSGISLHSPITFLLTFDASSVYNTQKTVPSHRSLAGPSPALARRRTRFNPTAVLASSETSPSRTDSTNLGPPNRPPTAPYQTCATICCRRLRTSAGRDHLAPCSMFVESRC